MLHLKKILASFVIGIFVFPLSVAFAGGSSMSIEVKGKPISAQADEMILSPLSLELKTYFLPDSKIENLRIDNLTIACYEGKNTFEKALLIENEQSLIATSNFAPGKNNLSTVEFSNIDLQNNSTYNFNLNFKVAEEIYESQVIHCGIQNITVTDRDRNEVLFSGMKTQEYVIVHPKESSTILVLEEIQ